jgi:tRNA dimethylallyltransferase
MNQTPATTRSIPIIIGPTAGGKTALAVELALRERAAGGEAEIVSADSMLLYRGMDIGTAKPTIEERRGVVHHLIDVAEPSESFSVKQWLDLAERTIADIRARGAWPIVVGGTHLYVKALLDGLFEGPGADEAVRARLSALPAAELRAMLEARDPAAAAKLHPNDLRRTVRALEVLELTGVPMSEHQKQWDASRGPREFTLAGLEWPVEAINRRINARVKEMMLRGLLEEVRSLRDRAALGPQAREALGYKQLLMHLDGRCTLEEAVEAIKIETRRFAKNQRTWARRLRTTGGSTWIDASTVPLEGQCEAVERACGASAG